MALSRARGLGYRDADLGRTLGMGRAVRPGVPPIPRERSRAMRQQTADSPHLAVGNPVAA